MRVSLLLGAAFLFAATSFATAQGTGSAVTPNVGNGVANSSSSYPWNRRASSIRVQYVYDQSEMPAFPVTITDVRFRPADAAATTTTWTGGTYGDMTILMSNSGNAWNAQSTVFAANHGTNQATVFSGAAVLTAGSGTGSGIPSKPYVNLKLAGSGFSYDPANGPLLVDFASDGSKWVGGTTTTNAVTSGTHKSSRMFNLSNHLATSGSVQQNVGLVMEFDYTFTGTYVDFTADKTSGVVGLKVQFTDTTVTSSTITAHDWDLDGDGNYGDSSVANPTFTYNTAGTFTIKHKVTVGGRDFEIVKKDLIGVFQPTASVPDLIQYQFNEVRGTKVANTASGSVAPAQGTVSNTAWQGQGKDATYSPNEPGFGLLAQAGASKNGITTGYNLNVKGDITICWWQKMVSTAPSNAFGYVFGGAGSNFRCFNRGAAGNNILFRGTSYGDVSFVKNIHDTNWHHLAIVVDDTNGECRAYVDGELTNTVTGTANSHTSTNTGFRVGYHTSIASNHANYYDMDDFRFYTKALNFGEILGAALGENASVGNYGTSCVTSGTAPVIAGINGRPTLGNVTFAAEMSGGPAAATPAAMVLGFLPAFTGFPQDLSILFGTGCVLEVPIFQLSLSMTSGGKATLGLPILNNPSFIGIHPYVQGGYLGTTDKGMTDLLDINVQQN